MMLGRFVEQYTEKLEKDVAILRKRGAPEQAEAIESVVEGLEAEAEKWQMETLTLSEAEEESGYSYSSLQKKVSAGDIPNAGKERSPRIRRKHLPRKPGAFPSEEPDTSEEAEPPEPRLPEVMAV